MGLKKFVKKNAPDWLFYLLRVGYRTVKFPYTLIQKAKHKRRISNIIARADKFLPYYRDELSRLILSDCEKYLLTYDENIFIDRAVKQGWKFHSLRSPGEAYSGLSNTIYSGILIIYDDKHSKKFSYTINLLSICNWSDRYRIMSLDEFINGAKVKEGEFIAPVMKDTNLEKFIYIMKNRNLFYRHNMTCTKLSSIREDIQYFDVFAPVEDEIIIDAGAYDGQTAKQFLQWAGDKVKKIYSFEFDPVNAAKCEENLKNLRDKVTLIKKGTWDKDETIYINAVGSTATSTKSTGSDIAYLTSIDSVVKDERVTFIKVDVEGAELKSLIGAKNTIIKNKPRLAICVYHKPEDIYEVPEYILSLVPEYKFYLRHYDSGMGETILYASCD